MTVMPELRPSMRPPELVLVSSLKEEDGVAVAGFYKLVMEIVKSRGG